MVTTQNNYDNIKKPVADTIPFSDDEKATKTFINNLSCKFMDISDSIESTGSLKTCKDALLYKPETPSCSHVSRHMPMTGSNDDKTSTQVNAMDTMLRNNKTTNSCFANEESGYKMIVDALMERPEEITSWLQDNYKGDHHIVVTTQNVNNNLSKTDNSYDNLGYGFIKDKRGHIDAFESQTMTVVLRKNEPEDNNPLGFNGLGFHVHTAYPGQRQSESYTELHGVNPMPDENVMSIIKKTNFYKNTSDMQKTCLALQASKKVNIPSQISVYYDKYGDAICFTAPQRLEKNENGMPQYAQTRYFIKKSDDKTQQTVISAAKYTKDAHDSEAVWHRTQSLPYPDCASENMKKYLGSMQGKINKCLNNIETKRIQRDAANKENERTVKDLQSKTVSNDNVKDIKE